MLVEVLTEQLKGQKLLVEVGVRIEEQSKPNTKTNQIRMNCFNTKQVKLMKFSN